MTSDYYEQVLFPNDGIVMILARMIGMLGPIDLDMLERGRESNKYFSEEFDLYHVNEVEILHSSLPMQLVINSLLHML